MMERINEKQLKHDCCHKTKDMVVTVIWLIKAALMILGAISLVYIDRSIMPHVDIYGAYQSVFTAAPRRAPSRLEVATSDPFIEHVLNGTKNMVFMEGHSTYRICDAMEAMIGETITLNAQSLFAGVPVARVVDGVRIKGVRRINLYGALAGDYMTNCGYCFDPPCVFCELPKVHEIYTWFAPGVEVMDVVQRGFLAEDNGDAYKNKRPSVCGGHSISGMHGYCFNAIHRYTELIPSNHAMATRISHKPYNIHIFKDPKDTGQCFIEIELVGP